MRFVPYSARIRGILEITLAQRGMYVLFLMLFSFCFVSFHFFLLCFVSFHFLLFVFVSFSFVQLSFTLFYFGLFCFILFRLSSASIVF